MGDAVERAPARAASRSRHRGRPRPSRRPASARLATRRPLARVVSCIMALGSAPPRAPQRQHVDHGGDDREEEPLEGVGAVVVGDHRRRRRRARLEPGERRRPTTSRMPCSPVRRDARPRTGPPVQSRLASADCFDQPSSTAMPGPFGAGAAVGDEGIAGLARAVLARRPPPATSTAQAMTGAWRNRGDRSGHRHGRQGDRRQLPARPHSGRSARPSRRARCSCQMPRPIITATARGDDQRSGCSGQPAAHRPQRPARRRRSGQRQPWTGAPQPPQT